MHLSYSRALAPALLMSVLLSTACASATRGGAATSPEPAASGSADLSALARARSDSALSRFTAADVRFMTRMIAHHAQAIAMAALAPTHGASSSVQILAARTINSQRDEIATMRQWLRDRGQPVPEATAAAPMAMSMTGDSASDMTAMPAMPGMLTEAQMRQLDRARGAEFDRLFLTYMIQHHRGAVSMVTELFDTYGAAQGDAEFRIATDINADQSTEIARMQRMLVNLIFQSGSR